MKRFALLLAAVGLGSGCIIESTPNLGSAAIYWSFWHSQLLSDFGSISSTATEVCAEAGVNEVDITLWSPFGDQLPISTGPCIEAGDVPGTVFLDLEPGTWSYYIEGLRGGVRVFDDSGTFSVSDGHQTVVDTYPWALYWDVQLNLTVPTCISTDTVEFSLTDTTYGVRYSTDVGTTNPPVNLSCMSPASMVIPSVPWAVAGVSSGSYVLTNIRQLDKYGAVVNYPSCIPHFLQPDTASTVLGVTINNGTVAPIFGC